MIDERNSSLHTIQNAELSEQNERSLHSYKILSLRTLNNTASATRIYLIKKPLSLKKYKPRTMTWFSRIYTVLICSRITDVPSIL